MEEKKLSKSKLRADIILIGAILLIAAAVFCIQLLNRSAGSFAVIYIDGRRTAAYPLSENRTVVLEENGFLNILTIEDGCADMTDADCPDRICVGMHPIRYVGETITCLPHRVVITIEGDSAPEVDIP